MAVPLPTNPFAVLSFIVAPAVLTNASSVLILSTSNRLARAVDRTRALSRELEASPDPSSEADTQRLRELTTAEKRSVLLMRALRVFYLAVSGFASAALLSLTGAILAESAPPAVATLLGYVVIAAGLVAVGSVVFGSVLLVRETQMAVAILSEQTESLRFRVTHRAPKG
jgi:MFS family permease